ncbi:hypothetical protein ACOMHN_059024 [Nucella lapillus]
MFKPSGRQAAEGGSSASGNTSLGQPQSSASISKLSRICPLCGKGFDRKEYFEDHVNMHSNIRAHRCPYCHHSFFYKNNLRQHVRDGIWYPLDYPGPATVTGNPAVSYTSPPTALPSVRHLSHARPPGPTPGCVIPTYHMSDALKAPSRRLYVCKECSMTFTSASGFRNHKKRVHQQKWKFSCHICEKKFMFKEHYEGHLNMHFNIKAFKCPNCPKQFAYKTGSSHSAPPPLLSQSGAPAWGSHTSPAPTHRNPVKFLLCEYCNASFASASGLDRHKKLLHLHKLPHMCLVCGKGFTERDHFEGHMNRHNNIKAHQCPQCSRQFTYKTSLRRHMRHRHL